MADAVADELQFHVESCVAELMRDGLSEDAARAEALRRFGDMQAHAEACRRQAPGAHMSRMMKIAVAGVAGSMAVALVTTGLLAFKQHGELAEARASQKRAEELVGKMNLELTQLRAAAGASVHDTGVVYVDGVIARPGVYSLPAVGDLRASRLVAAAGGIKADVHIEVEPDSESDQRIKEWQAKGATVVPGYHQRPALRVRLSHADGLQGIDPVLRANDMVRVIAAGE